MKTREELEAMSHEDLADYANTLQTKEYVAEFVRKENEHMKEILSAIGIVYQAYKKISDV